MTEKTTSPESLGAEPCSAAYLEQWLRENEVTTVHRPHIHIAAENFFPWQASNGFEMRCGITEEAACKCLARAISVPFDPSDESLIRRTPKQWKQNVKTQERAAMGADSSTD